MTCFSQQVVERTNYKTSSVIASTPLEQILCCRVYVCAILFTCLFRRAMRVTKGGVDSSRRGRERRVHGNIHIPPPPSQHADWDGVRWKHSKPRRASSLASHWPPRKGNGRAILKSPGSHKQASTGGLQIRWIRETRLTYYSIYIYTGDFIVCTLSTLV